MMNGKLGLCSADVTGEKKHPQAKNAASKRLRFSFYVAAPCSRKIGKISLLQYILLCQHAHPTVLPSEDHLTVRALPVLAQQGLSAIGAYRTIYGIWRGIVGHLQSRPPLGHLRV